MSFPEQMMVANAYMQARLVSKNAECLSLVTDDVKLHSERDGNINGKSSFSKYLSTVHPQGKWQAPTVENGKVVIRGTVKICLIPVPVKAVFEFRGKQISGISIGR